VSVHGIFRSRIVSLPCFRIEQYRRNQCLHVAAIAGHAKGHAVGCKRSAGECAGYTRHILRAGIAGNKMLDHAPRDEGRQVRMHEDGIQRIL